jgi:predicted ATPase
MKLSNLQLINFKRFDEESIDLNSPVNIFVGPNSSGKSSIIKALLALKQTASSSNENEVFAAQGDYVDLGTYRDYVFEHAIDRTISIKVDFSSTVLTRMPVSSSNESQWVKFAFTCDKNTQQAKLSSLVVGDSSQSLFKLQRKKTRQGFSISFDSEQAKQLISQFLSASEPQKKSMQMGEGSVTVEGRYRIEPDSTLRTRPLDNVSAFIANDIIGAILRELDRTIFYVGPIRQSPSRTYQRTGHLLSVGSAGEKTASVLTNLITRARQERSKDRPSQRKIDQLAKWIGMIFPERNISIANIDELIKLVISRPSGNGEAILDVGFGMSQILPILAQIVVMPEDSTLLVEQPELHLHPKAQSQLARIIAEAVSTGNKRFIVETHSEHFARGIQLAISDSTAGKVNEYNMTPADVKFLYIPYYPDKPYEMNINEWGEFTDKWPTGFFDEAYQATLRLLMNKGGSSQGESDLQEEK